MNNLFIDRHTCYSSCWTTYINYDIQINNMLHKFMINKEIRFHVAHIHSKIVFFTINFSYLHHKMPQGRIQVFFRRGATPINHIYIYFCRISVVLESRRSSQGVGVHTPCTLPLDPPLYHVCEAILHPSWIKM